MTLDLARLHDHARAVRQAIGRCEERAQVRERMQWFSLRWQIPERDILADFLASESRDAFYWQEPSRDLAILGLGGLVAIQAVGRERFPEAARRARDLFDNLWLHSLELPAAPTLSEAQGSEAPVADARGPLLLGGFAFFDHEVTADSEWFGLGPGRLLLPEISIVCRDGSAWVTRTCAIEIGSEVDEIFEQLSAEVSFTGSQPLPDREIACDLGLTGTIRSAGPEFRVQADRTHSRYMAQVEMALASIAAGKFEKVVLARSLRVTGDCDFDLDSFLSSLRTMFPSCTTLAVRAGGDLFVSATPERLVALDGDRVTTAAVAGSAPRGRSPLEEARHSAALLESEKERVEHDVVKRSIRKALWEPCGRLDGPELPRLLMLEGIQHLETPLSGRLLPSHRDTTGVLDLVGQLHPTPAVGGAPSSTALDWLEHFEALDRGWYAGPVGYVDGLGNGEFKVALRSALLRGRTARLFAGAGVVAGSNPSSELAETRLKLRALLAPLTEI